MNLANKSAIVTGQSIGAWTKRLLGRTADGEFSRFW